VGSKENTKDGEFTGSATGEGGVKGRDSAGAVVGKGVVTVIGADGEGILKLKPARQPAKPININEARRFMARAF